MRMAIKALAVEYDQTEDDIKALQSVGQIIGEILKQLDDQRCGFIFQQLKDRTTMNHRR